MHRSDCKFSGEDCERGCECYNSSQRDAFGFVTGKALCTYYQPRVQEDTGPGEKMRTEKLDLRLIVSGPEQGMDGAMKFVCACIDTGLFVEILMDRLPMAVSFGGLRLRLERRQGHG